MSKISYGDYLKIVGLMVIAKEGMRQLAGLESAMAEILGKKVGVQDTSHISDEIYGGDCDPNRMLKHMDFTIEKQKRRKK